MNGPNDVTKSANSFGGDNNPEEQVLNMLTTFFGAMGNAPDGPGSLGLMATALSSRADPHLVNMALNRCMAECRFPVRLPDIFSRIPGFDVEVNAEKRLAWDTVVKFVRKYVGNDVYGNFGPEHGWYPQNFPKLSSRLLDTVRRTGGWAVYAKLCEDDFPHQQKRFFEEYQAWTEIQHVASDPAKVLEMPRPRVIEGEVAKPIEPPSIEPSPKPATVVKDFYEPPTVEQLADRALHAKARLADYLKQKREEGKP